MSEASKLTVKVAYMGIVLFGIISLAGDLIYEGARSIIPQYLNYLGAPAIAFGVVIGLGEFIGYGLRLVSGFLVDKLRSYWAFTMLGYLLLAAIPLLAITGNWQLALLLILIERLAKAIRSPARDTLLSHISKSVGAGKAFGLHELMDQIGAVGGPAIATAALYLTGGAFSKAFTALSAPYILLVAALLLAYRKLKPYTIDLRREPTSHSTISALPSKFWFYLAAVLINTAGLIHISLILFRASPIAAPWVLSTLYLIVQGVDAVAAPIAGLAYDNYGRKVLLIPFALSILPAIFTFIGGFSSIIIAALIFGIILGMQESIYRAAVAELSAIEYRGLAYGTFYIAYGLGFVVSGAVYGYFINLQLTPPIVAYALITQIIAVILLLKAVH